MRGHGRVQLSLKCLETLLIEVTTSHAAGVVGG